MSPVFLKLMNGTTLSSNVVSLISYQNMITTKAPISGRWYYEVTHIKGSNSPSFGFSFGAISSQSFVVGHGYGGDSWKVFAYEDIEVNLNSFQSTTVVDIPQLGQYESGFTIGISFDTFSRIFSVFYNNKFYHMNILCTKCLDKITPIFIEATSSDPLIKYEDVIQVNFGSEPFKYGLPTGYMPWNSNKRSITCKKNFLFSLRIVSTILISTILSF